MKGKRKETLEQKVLRERKLKELSFDVDSLIVKIVKGVEEINSLKGIGEVKVGTKYFEESHEVISMLGYDDSFGIVMFRIPLNKVGKLAWFWNPRQELIHECYWDWHRNCTRSNLEATVQMYENLITLLNSANSKLEDEKSKLGGKLKNRKQILVICNNPSKGLVFEYLNRFIQTFFVGIHSEIIEKVLISENIIITEGVVFKFVGLGYPFVLDCDNFQLEKIKGCAFDRVFIDCDVTLTREVEFFVKNHMKDRGDSFFEIEL